MLTSYIIYDTAKMKQLKRITFLQAQQNVLLKSETHLWC